MIDNPFGEDDGVNKPTKPVKPVKKKRGESLLNPFDDDDQMPTAPPPPPPTLSPLEAQDDGANSFGEVGEGGNPFAPLPQASAVRDTQEPLTIVAKKEETFKRNRRPSDILDSRRSSAAVQSRKENHPVHSLFELSDLSSKTDLLKKMEIIGFDSIEAKQVLLSTHEAHAALDEKKRVKRTPGLMDEAIQQLLDRLKASPLYEDHSLFNQNVIAKVSSWLPNVYDPETEDTHTHYIVNVRVLLPMPRHHQVQRRFRHFKALYSAVSWRLWSIGVSKNAFPSIYVYKSNSDKARTIRQAALQAWLDEILTTSILIGDPFIAAEVFNFLEVSF